MNGFKLSIAAAALAAAFVVPGAAYASDIDAAAKSFADKMTQGSGACEKRGESARAIMRARQNRLSMSKVMSATNGSEAVRNLVISAYEHPAFRTDDAQQAAIAEFGNAAELACYKAQ